jgi:hypothetical protein
MNETTLVRLEKALYLCYKAYGNPSQDPARSINKRWSDADMPRPKGLAPLIADYPEEELEKAVKQLERETTRKKAEDAERDRAAAEARKKADAQKEIEQRSKAELDKVVRRKDLSRKADEIIEARDGKAGKDAWADRFIAGYEAVEASTSHQWLVEGILVNGQSMFMGGPKKSYKTSVALDLAVSLASGTPFLGHFAVPKPKRVLMLSGESGGASLRETASRVASARGLDIKELTRASNRGTLELCATLPDITDPGALAYLAEETERWDVELTPEEIDDPGLQGCGAGGYDVVIIDPLYLCFPGGGVNSADLMSMGTVLQGLVGALPGRTIVLLHHAKKDVFPRRALTLGDLAFAGVGEFARQWLLLNWRRPYHPDETRRLIASYGGSANPGGVFALDIEEGTMGADFTGRTWETSVRDLDEARESERTRGKAKRAERAESRADGLRDALLSVLPADGTRLSYSKVRTALGSNPPDTDRAIERAAAAGLVKHEHTGTRRFVWRTEPQGQQGRNRSGRKSGRVAN